MFGINYIVIIIIGPLDAVFFVNDSRIRGFCIPLSLFVIFDLFMVVKI